MPAIAPRLELRTESPASAGLLFAGHWRVTASYGVAHFGKSLFWQAGELLLAFFLTEAAGLAPVMMGGVITLSLAASAVSDLLIGHGLRRRLSHVEGAIGLQLGGAIVAALALVGLFTTAHLPEAMRLPFALCAAVVFRISYSLYDTPQNVLLSLATPNPHSRSRAVSMRIAVSGAAGLTLALAVAPLLVDDGFPSQATRFVLLTLAMSIIAVGSAALLFATMRGTAHGTVHGTVHGDRPDAFAANAPGVVAPARAGTMSMHQDAPALWPLLGMLFMLLMTVPLFGKLEPYFAVHVLKSSAWGGVIVTASALGSIVSQPLWRRLVAGQERATAIVGFGLMILACAGIWVALGQRPAAATVCAALLGMAGGGLGMTLWAGFADTAARLHPLRVGLAYGLLTGTSKLALAAGALLLGAILGGIDYRGADSGRIVWLMALGPAIGAGACIVMALAWRFLSGPGAETGNERMG